jgi:flagellar basal-body rod protein FlgC
MNTTNKNHISKAASLESMPNKGNEMEMDIVEDNAEGDWVHMPEHPNANEEGYVELSNVNVINEMIDMIAATRSYEANLTAFNASKQMAKDALEI